MIKTSKPNLIEPLTLIESNAKPCSDPTKTSRSFEHEKIKGSNSSKKIWIEAYGCSASMADSEMISGLLKADGYEIATDENESALNIIVTCSVKDVTQHRMLYRIEKLSKSMKPLGRAAARRGARPDTRSRACSAFCSFR